MNQWPEILLLHTVFSLRPDGKQQQYPESFEVPPTYFWISNRKVIRKGRDCDRIQVDQIELCELDLNLTGECTVNGVSTHTGWTTEQIKLVQNHHCNDERCHHVKCNDALHSYVMSYDGL